jgi:glutaminyl-tRNA synthetase
LSDTDSKKGGDDRPANFIEEIITADLENGVVAADKVALRFPPEPNGYLHVGHTKAICLNFGLAKKFGGTCNLRFDDTNPTKEETEYVEAIKRDVEWLGFTWDALYFASDYFEKLYEFAVELIKTGKAYVCSLDAEKISEYRGNYYKKGIDSPYRERSVQESLDLFTRMRAGEFKDGEHTLRAKIDMNHPEHEHARPTAFSDSPRDPSSHR